MYNCTKHHLHSAPITLSKVSFLPHFPSFAHLYLPSPPSPDYHYTVVSLYTYTFFKRFYLFIFRESGKEEEREEEKHQCVVASCEPPTRDLACNPGMCPDWESNQWPFGSQVSTQSTEPQTGWVQLLWDSLSLDLYIYFLHQIKEVFFHKFFK